MLLGRWAGSNHYWASRWARDFGSCLYPSWRSQDMPIEYLRYWGFKKSVLNRSTTNFWNVKTYCKLETCGFTQSCLQPDTQVWYFSRVHRVWLEMGISVVLLRNDFRFPDLLLPVELRYHSLKGQANHINCNEQNKYCHIRSQQATCICFVTTYQYTCTIIQKW